MPKPQTAPALSQPPSEPPPAPTDPRHALSVRIRPDGSDVSFSIPLAFSDDGRYVGVLMIEDTPHYIDAIEVREEGDVANIAVNPDYQDQIDRALETYGEGPLCTTKIGERDFVILMLPFSD